MLIQGDYQADGFALIEPEIAKQLLDEVWSDAGTGKVRFSFAEDSGLVSTRSVEMHGARYPPLKNFLWGLTPFASMMAGRSLLPSYCFFRLYKEGDVLRVHSDRAASELTLSLTLGYSDGREWPLELSKERVARAKALAEDFGAEEVVRLSMNVGDAVLYRGSERRHGRTTPNPNSWSAHLFLNWVDADGPNRTRAFEQTNQPQFD